MIELELSLEQIEKVMCDTLLSTLEDIDMHFLDNKLRKNQLETKFPPMFSYDYKEEKKQLKKLKKQFNVVYNWYTGKTFEGKHG